MLQLRERVDHHRVVEVLLDHALEEREVVGRELRDALVEGARDLWVGRHPALEHVTDVGLALAHVEAQLAHVAEHQLLV